jgi:hypothetical protein
MDTKQNGAHSLQISSDLRAAAPPDTVNDLAEGCVRFVERALGVRLDYRPETLPVLDHYVEQARSTASDRAEVLAAVAHMVGAYFGEVIRRRHASWWRLPGKDPTYWQLEFECVYLAFSPMLFIRDALTRDQAEANAHGDDEERLDGEVAAFELEEGDRQTVAERLAELPAVSEAEYYAPSTRLEVIDIAVDAIRARRIAAGEDVDAGLGPDDYAQGDG